MAPSNEVRTYGNWRKPGSPGIGKLGTVGTALLFVGLVVVAFAMLMSLVAGLVTAVVVGLALAPMLVQDRNGRTALQFLVARLAWLRGRTAGWNLYRAGPLTARDRGTCRLPGLLAPTRLVEAQDAYGRDFAMIVMPSTGHYSVVFECGADGAMLVDSEQVDTWVAYWGQWLSSLAFEPGLIAASVTIEAAPDLGHRLAREVGDNVDPRAPQLARRALAEIVRTYPAGSATVSTRITVTYSASARPGARRRSADEMAREISTRLPGLTSGLAMTGAGSARPMTADQLVRAVKVAFDEDAQLALDGLPDAELGWEDAGPSAAQEFWDRYTHDSGISITWGMYEAPRSEVVSNVLTGLVSPHEDIVRKRVSILYRPHDPGSSARLVEKDRRDARFKIAGSNVAARDSVAVAAADQAAREEARGAGLTRFALLVTATVRSVDALPSAVAAIDALAAPARIRLRRMYGSQSAAFAACLPLGVVLPHHVQVPSIIRESA
ncbi:SCO6880 family protein [Actinomadura rayongensis]|uniref:PrgI family protein n=1 Tax=Actinomadura rayongensis TaxID=1429076 RepID=A0A6I4W641_9ACTN|nr:SCO6880 family protein [Actinomadura rayongensis]MXQ65637.1 hypothetical protein [Actinomadura rayongensis]